MSEELKSINTPVPDEVLTMRILQTLPPSYGTFRTVWNNVSIYDPSLTNLAAKLVEEEQQLKAKNNGVIDPADVAFFATHPSRIQQQQQQQQQQQLTDDAKAVRGGHNEGRGDTRIPHSLVCPKQIMTATYHSRLKQKQRSSLRIQRSLIKFSQQPSWWQRLQERRSQQTRKLLLLRQTRSQRVRLPRQESRRTQRCSPRQPQQKERWELRLKRQQLIRLPIITMLRRQKTN